LGTRVGRGVSCFQFYVGAIVFAWLGNACYSIFPPGDPLHDLAPLPVALSLILFSFVHGARRYGLDGAAAFFGIVIAIGWTIESVGVMTSVPFGAYHYAESMQPFIGVVPLSVLFAYFAMSYPAWIVASMIVGRFDNDFDSRSINAISVCAAMLMVFWDLSMDPLRATIEGRWIWDSPGVYLGIPMSNFLGWFLTAWLMFRAFGVWLLANRGRLPQREEFAKWPFWAVGAMVYLSFCGEYLLNAMAAVGGDTAFAGLSVDAVRSGAALTALLTMVPAAVFAVRRTIAALRPTPERNAGFGRSLETEPIRLAGDTAG
jgi:uncharacterized membrane protein